VMGSQSSMSCCSLVPLVVFMAGGAMDTISGGLD
jgi:hypothetical protein